jgi:hypothetical protein
MMNEIDEAQILRTLCLKLVDVIHGHRLHHVMTACISVLTDTVMQLESPELEKAALIEIGSKFIYDEEYVRLKAMKRGEHG